MNLKPFSLELAKQGHPVVTRDGRPVRIICFDRKDSEYNQPIVGLMCHDTNDIEDMESFNVDGRYNVTEGDTRYDLFMAPRKVTKWVNFFRQGEVVQCGYAHDSKEIAEKEAGPDNKRDNYLGAFPVEIEL